MPLSRISQKQILARVTLNGTDGTAADAGDFIVQSTSADEDDNILLEDSTDFGTDILTSEGITPPENIFRHYNTSMVFIKRLLYPPSNAVTLALSVYYFPCH